MKFIATAFAALILAAPAAAAPPTNDNRDDALVLPTFPATVHGTTAEATVERLDPQVSRCGRIENTVWYWIQSAPDGTIVATVQAAARLAPVVRIYRRNQSNIQELDCARANAGGKAVVSLQTVRGAGYLIVVGRRPGTADGAFDLRADLFLPPANDESDDAVNLGAPPRTVRSTTLGATHGASDSCGMSGGSVWYRLRGPKSGRVLLRLETAEELDAIVAVHRRVRSRLDTVMCGRTDAKGRSSVTFPARPGATYLVAIGEQPNSSPGAFTLQVRAAEAPERGSGRALPRRGVHQSVNGATDVNDLWSVRLRRGVTYRIAFSSSPCAGAVLRARARRFRLACNSYLAFTPGRDGGGRYTIEVSAYAAQPHRYRLRVAKASADDVGVGIELAPNSSRRGRLSPSGVDVVDLYHFDVQRLSEVRLGLSLPAGRPYTLAVLTDSGSRLSSGSARARLRLDRGRYVVAVQAPVGTSAGRYRLTLRLRDVTSTSVRVSAAEISPGSAVTISCEVSPASGGLVELQIDRFDPLTGWHFYRVARVRAGSSISWRPPAPGRWRLRATFLGTSSAARSRSGYAHVVVARPI